jgi:hypothetical protein
MVSFINRFSYKLLGRRKLSSVIYTKGHHKSKHLPVKNFQLDGPVFLFNLPKERPRFLRPEIVQPDVAQGEYLHSAHLKNSFFGAPVHGRLEQVVMRVFPFSLRENAWRHFGQFLFDQLNVDAHRKAPVEDGRRVSFGMA